MLSFGLLRALAARIRVAVTNSNARSEKTATVPTPLMAHKLALLEQRRNPWAHSFRIPAGWALLKKTQGRKDRSQKIRSAKRKAA